MRTFLLLLALCSPSYGQQRVHDYHAAYNRAIDGDTVELTVDLGFRLTYRDRFRLLGVNTPERGQPGFDEATRFVNVFLSLNKDDLRIVTTKPGKYGRWLCVVYYLWEGEWKCLNTALLDKELGVPYLFDEEEFRAFCDKHRPEE